MQVTKNDAVGTGLRILAGWLLCWSLVPLPAALAQAPAPVPLCKSLVATGNPEYSPYLWRDPQDDTRLMGASADLMQLLAQEIGIPIEVKYVGSWARVQEEARSGRIDLVAGAFLTQARLEYMDYFQPAFWGTRTVIWTHPNKTFTYRTWNDLRGRQGLTVSNNSFGEAFDSFAKRSLSITTVPTLEQALKMLSLARVDYLIYEEDPGQAYAAKLGIAKLKTATTAISSEGLFLTFPHKSVCNTAEMRARIAKALFKLTRDNAMKKLVDANIQLWRKQTHL